MMRSHELDRGMIHAVTQHDRLDDVRRVDDMFRRAGLPDAPSRPPADPRIRGRRRLRAGIATGLSLLVVAALVAAYCHAALTAPLPVPTGAVARPEVAPGPAAALVLPTTGEFAVSVAGADEYLGPNASTSFAAVGGDGAAPMASISKLVTALVVLDRKPLGASGTGPTITFTKADHDLYDSYYVRGATIAEMPASMSEHDAIETMLVASASNYAEAVSTWAFGSQSSFLAATRSWLAKKGLTHTRMVDPTGLDPRNVSTPSDLIALGKLALADPAVAAIVAQKTLDVPGVPNYAATNTLLGADGVDGIKTGTLPGVANLLFSAKVSIRGLPQPVRLVGVDLGSPSHENTEADVDSFVQSLGDGFHDVRVATAGRVVGTYTTPWGSRARMVLRDTASVFTWSDTAVSSRMTPVVLGSGKKGSRVGSVTWTAGSQTVTVPVVLDRGIRPPSDWWRLTHPHELLGWG